MDIKQTWSVYGLKETGTDEIRYVGISHNPIGRIKNHIHCALRLKLAYPHYDWIRELNNQSKVVEYIILESDIPTMNEAFEREVYHIAHQLSIGHRLLNTTAGGKKGVKFTEKHKHKLSLAHVGHIHSEETKQKMRGEPKPKKYSAERIQGMSQAQQRRKKVVHQYTLSGELVNTYHGLCEAARANNVNKTSICKCCLGLTKTILGYVWKYADEVEHKAAA